MQLAITTDCLSRNAGGLFQGVLRLAQELGAQGCTVSVFGVSDDRSEEDLEQWLPLRPQVFPLCGPKFFGFAPGLTRAIVRQRPDVIDLHGLWKFTSIAARRSRQRLGCPYLVHPHGMLDRWAVQNSGWKKRLAAWAYERRSLAAARCIRALNPAEAAAIRAYGLPNPICIVPNGTDLPDEKCSRTGDSAGQPPSPGDTSPFPAGRKVLLYLGRIHPKKNLANLLHAWSLVQKSSPATSHSDGWLLAIAGWDQGGHEAELRRLTEELEIQDSILFLGPRFGGGKADCYRHSDAFVLPSLSEGLPIVVLEAWSHQKPVVMTAQCNLPEGFSLGGALCVGASPEEIGRGIQCLLEMSVSERSTMGEKGRAIVKQRYLWPQVARQMREVYDWMLGAGSAPPCVEIK